MNRCKETQCAAFLKQKIYKSSTSNKIFLNSSFSTSSTRAPKIPYIFHGCRYFIEENITYKKEITNLNIFYNKM